MFCFLCMLAACVIYPLGWDNTKVKQICGLNAEKYKRGDCEIRWAYILAMIGIFDALFLCILGYILGSKQVKLLPEAAMRSKRKFIKKIVHGILCHKLSCIFKLQMQSPL